MTERMDAFSIEPKATHPEENYVVPDICHDISRSSVEIPASNGKLVTYLPR